MDHQQRHDDREPVRGARDVLVIGGGVIGLSIAWRLAADGLGVVLADPAPGRGATWAAAGMLAPVSEVVYGEEDLLSLNLLSASMYPSFVADLEEVTGASVGYKACGTMNVALDADDRSELMELSQFHAALGLETVSLSSTECRSAEPALSPGLRAGLLVPGDHQVDNRRLAGALLDAACLRGVSIVRSPVASLEVRHGRVHGAHLSPDTRIACGQAVLAAGCWSRQIGGIPTGSLPPVRPVKGQILRLKAQTGDRLLSRTVHGIVRGEPVYVVPRDDGEIVVGATVEEMGFDTTVTAGAVYRLLRDAVELVPELAEVSLVETMAALRPGSPDNGPLLGETGVEGLHAATGHHRNGVLQAPVTAEAIASLVAGRGLPSEVRPFSPRRFEHRRPEGRGPQGRGCEGPWPAEGVGPRGADRAGVERAPLEARAAPW